MPRYLKATAGLTVFLLLMASSALAPMAHGAFPGANGKIAFMSNRDGNSDIYLMNADGSGRVNLTNNPAWDMYSAWSPDGTKIAFVSDRDGNTEIYVMNADGGGQTNLTNTSAGEGSPAWSPDGTKIAFTRDVGVSAGRLVIHVMNPDGSGQSALIGPQSDNPNWSPDGSRITFSSDRAGLFHPDIYVANADGSGQTRLTTTMNDHYSVWAPDGGKIAFGSYRDGTGEIYVMNPDGSGQTRITNSPAGVWNDRPDWQPIPPIPVQIDVKPGTYPNSVNPKSIGKIPVAILTTSDFDAATVDPATVRFGATGTEAAPVHSALEDVDGDGDADMILHFKTQETGIACGATSAILTGETQGGQAIEGGDPITTPVPE